MELKLYFRMLQRSWWIVVLTAIAAAIGALLYSYFATPTYRATARFIIAPNPAYITGDGDFVQSLEALDKRSIVTTYAEILKSPRMYRETLAILNLKQEALEDYVFSAIVLPDTNIIEFSFQGPDPALAASLTNSIGGHVVEYVYSLYQVYELTFLDPAVQPEEPISPQPFRDTLISLVVGLALGVALALVREMLRTPIESFRQQRDLDEMSMALNRNAFDEKLERVSFASATDFSLCLVNLAGLKEYIDVLPTATSQTILRHVNQTLRNQLRGNDLVGRWNDVEFSVLLNETPGQAALNTMDRVRTALSVPIKIDISGDDLYLRPEIGIAEYRIGDTGKSVMKNTRWALDMARQGSTGGVYLLKATDPI